MTREQALAYANDPDSPLADAIQIHDLYDAAGRDQSARLEESEFTRLAHVSEKGGQPMPEEVGR